MSALARALLASRFKAVVQKRTTGWPEAMERIAEALHPRQHDFVFDPGRRVSMRCSRGSGKTTAVGARQWMRCLTTPKARCLYIATSRPHAEELLWEPLKEVNERLGLEATFHESKLRMTLRKNGAALRLVGMDDRRALEKLRGLPHHEVTVDEAQSNLPHLLENLLLRVIGPRLGDYGGCLILGGTPSPTLRGPYYEATRPGGDVNRKWEDRDLPEFANWKKWSLHHWTLKDGAPFVPAMRRLWEEALIEKEANGWSDQHPIWRREYMAEWASDDSERVFKYRPHTDDGAEWNQWNPGRDVNGVAILPKGHEWQYVIGMDMGHADPFALSVFAYSPTYSDLLHVYEFGKREMYAKKIAEVLIGAELNHDRYGGVIGAIGWPDGMVADTAGLGGAMLDELAQVYGIKIKPADKKNKFDSIELFNGDLVDGRVKILKGSVLEEQLQDLQWVTDDYGNLKEDKSARNDMTDAAIYARREARHLFEPSAPPKGAPSQRERFDAATTGGIEEQSPDDFSSWLSNATYDDFWG